MTFGAQKGIFLILIPVLLLAGSCEMFSPKSDSSTDTGGGSGYTDLVWSDEFNSGAVNTSVWSYDIGNGDWGWGTGSLEYDQAANATFENDGGTNGFLVMTAKKESTSGFAYSSVRMKTQGKKFWSYGKIEARIKLPNGYGIWPAFWMLGENVGSAGWPACGEIDIMEMAGGNDSVIHGTLHYTGGDPGALKTISDQSGWHIYQLMWNSSMIKIGVDDSYYFNATPTETFKNKNFFIILDLAVGGNFFGDVLTSGKTGFDPSKISATFPQTMKIDWIRVYQ